MAGNKVLKVLSEHPVPIPSPIVLPFTPVAELEHLLKVAASVCQDANNAWAEVWAFLKACATPEGMVTPEAEKGFTPECGWPAFLEKVWLIKYYLDSIQRVCTKQH